MVVHNKRGAEHFFRVETVYFVHFPIENTNVFKLPNIKIFSGRSLYGFLWFCSVQVNFRLNFVLNLINVVVSNKSMVADKKGGNKLPWRHVN